MALLIVAIIILIRKLHRQRRGKQTSVKELENEENTSQSTRKNPPSGIPEHSEDILYATVDLKPYTEKQKGTETHINMNAPDSSVRHIHQPKDEVTYAQIK